MSSCDGVVSLARGAGWVDCRRDVVESLRRAGLEIVQRPGQILAGWNCVSGRQKTVLRGHWDLSGYPLVPSCVQVGLG